MKQLPEKYLPEKEVVKDALSCGAFVHKIENGVTYVLLVRPKEDRDVWGLPKGHINPDETGEQCAIREVFEETGVKIKLEKRLQNCFTQNSKERKIVITWLATVEGDDFPNPQDGENFDVKWFDIENLPKLHKYQLAVIRQGVEILINRRYENDNLSKKLPNWILRAVYDLFKIAPYMNDWIQIKKQLVSMVRFDKRRYFSNKKRDGVLVNKFEVEIINLWTLLTEKPVLFNDGTNSEDLKRDEQRKNTDS